MGEDSDEMLVSPSAVSCVSLVSYVLLTPEPPSTVSELLLSLVLGSLLGLGGGCFRPWLESLSPPPTECRDWDRTAKPWLTGGRRSCGAGIVMKPILKCFPEYAPSVAIATFSPILHGQMRDVYITHGTKMLAFFSKKTKHPHKTKWQHVFYLLMASSCRLFFWCFS